MSEFAAHAQSASATSISFQGVLKQPDGAPLANNAYNLWFRFWDGPAPGGTPVSTNILVPAVPVTNGLANAAIPMDPAWFNGQTRYLGVAVTTTNELLPRLMVTAVPHAAVAGNLYPDPSYGDPRVTGTLRVSNGMWVENAPLNSFSYIGRFRQGYYPNWNGTGREADFYRLIGQGDPHSGFGVAIGEDIASPVAWMYEQPGNAFKVVKVGSGDQVRDGVELFTVSSTGTAACKVLQITGGADLAEHLSVTDSNPADAFAVVPGMVVSIDSTGQRKFKLSDEPYDRKRVGIISGGIGVKPGLVLRDEGNPQADGEHPIALTGQVWCHADATFGPIAPGDLLTTSATPGHAMRASDFDKARFAVLGQALTGLKDGRGWVQVLVGKQ